jgi:hypothetical protein
LRWHRDKSLLTFIDLPSDFGWQLLGSTMRQEQAQVYSRIKNVLIPNMYYRADVDDRWTEDSDRLHVWGYLR